MSYSQILNFNITLSKSLKIVQACQKCGCKQLFINTNRFRINANKNRLDIWLIYQCEKCRHTRNLTVYERKTPAQIDRKEYELFCANDLSLAQKYGKNKEFFAKNNAPIAWNEVKYDYVSPDGKTPTEMEPQLKSAKIIIVKDVYRLGIREEKVAADVLLLSRSKVKKLISEEKLKVEKKTEKNALVYRITINGLI